MIVLVLVLLLVISSGGSRGGARAARLPPHFWTKAEASLVSYFVLELIAIDAFIAISDDCIQHLVRLKREKIQQAYGFTPFGRENFFQPVKMFFFFFRWHSWIADLLQVHLPCKQTWHAVEHWLYGAAVKVLKTSKPSGKQMVFPCWPNCLSLTMKQCLFQS